MVGEGGVRGFAALAPLQPPALDLKLRLGGVRVVWQPTAVTGRTGRSLLVLATTQPLAASSSGPRIRVGPCGCERGRKGKGRGKERDLGGGGGVRGCAALAPLQPPALDLKLRLGGVRVV